jgi:hypothetical protein
VTMHSQRVRSARIPDIDRRRAKIMIYAQNA